MKTSIIVIVIVVVIAIATTIYMLTVKKKVITKIDEPDLPETYENFEMPSTSLTTEDWKLRLKKGGLGHHWEKFESLLKHEVRISHELVDESEINPGQSKIGGRPDLPQKQLWFKDEMGKSLSFVAQINLSEASHYDQSNQLPTEGIIYFFYSAEQEAWGFDPKDKDKFKVFYFNGDKSEIRRTEFPSDLPEQARFNSCKLSFASTVSMPNWESELIEFLSDDEKDIYTELTVDGEITKLLGHSDNIQGMMEEECQLVTNGLYCGDPSGYNDPRAKALRKGADQWTLLFQIDSIDDAGMMWGDVGRVYFWIKKDDLVKKQFDKSWFVLQCS